MGRVPSPADLRRLRRVLVDADRVGGIGGPQAAGDGAEALSDEALRGYFLGLHDRDAGAGGGEAVA